MRSVRQEVDDLLSFTCWERNTKISGIYSTLLCVYNLVLVGSVKYHT